MSRIGTDQRKRFSSLRRLRRPRAQSSTTTSSGDEMPPEPPVNTTRTEQIAALEKMTPAERWEFWSRGAVALHTLPCLPRSLPHVLLRAVHGGKKHSRSGLIPRPRRGPIAPGRRCECCTKRAAAWIAWNASAPVLNIFRLDCWHAMLPTRLSGDLITKLAMIRRWRRPWAFTVPTTTRSSSGDAKISFPCGPGGSDRRAGRRQQRA